MANSGQKPGLSVNLVEPSGKKSVRIEVSRLVWPLTFIPDDPSSGGVPGHGVITPINEDGQVDQALLEEWAASRESQSDQPHHLTQLLIKALEVES